MRRKKRVVRKVCGIMMPISTMKVGDLTYSEEYWKGVLAFLMDAIKEAGFEPIVAWENDKSDVIHAKIVQNIESHDVMMAVLVGNNPNVWLECGMRLWTQKPLLLLVSDKGGRIPFDVSPVNCLRFPEDCHYGKLKMLKKEIKDSLKRITSPEHPSILSHFAAVRPSANSPAIEEKELSKFMTETRAAISKLQSQIETDKALYMSPSGGPMHSSVIPYLSQEYQNSSKYKNLIDKYLDEVNTDGWLSGLNGATGPSGPTINK